MSFAKFRKYQQYSKLNSLLTRRRSLEKKKKKENGHLLRVQDEIAQVERFLERSYRENTSIYLVDEYLRLALEHDAQLVNIIAAISRLEADFLDADAVNSQILSELPILQSAISGERLRKHWMVLEFSEEAARDEDRQRMSFYHG